MVCALKPSSSLATPCRSSSANGRGAGFCFSSTEALTTRASLPVHTSMMRCAKASSWMRPLSSSDGVGSTPAGGVFTRAFRSSRLFTGKPPMAMVAVTLWKYASL
ncbi:hypothetical protein D9M71_761030 [compost metagenome]